MCSHRHFVLRIIIALLVGVIVTIALSCLAKRFPTGNAWYGPPATEDIGLWKTDDGYTIWQISRGSNAWHEVVTYWHMQISGQSLMIQIEDYEARTFDFRTLPGHFRPDSLDDLNIYAWYHETGFPFPAMTCSVHWNTQASNADIIYDVLDGVQLPRDADFNPRALPLRALWPGFLINVLIWGTVWFALMHGWSVLRAKLRARGDRCIHCGYSRQGLPAGSRCPECGGRSISTFEI